MEGTWWVEIVDLLSDIPVYRQLPAQTTGITENAKTFLLQVLATILTQNRQIPAL